MSTSNLQLLIELRWTDSQGVNRTQQAEVQSVDRTTIRLMAPVTLAFGQLCEIVFGGKETTVPLIKVRIRDVRPMNEKRCRLTCHFEESLTEPVIAALADAGCFNRRSSDRRAVSVDVHARPELTQGQDPLGVRVVDLSAGGCCLKSRQEVPLGHRIMLSVTADMRSGGTVPMRVQWQQSISDGWLIGCSFCQPTGYEEMASLVLEQPEASGGGPANERLLNRVLFLAGAGLGLSH